LRVATFAPLYDTNDRILPFDPSPTVTETQIKVPESFSDPSHVAHIVWKYCHFIESIETKQQPRQPNEKEAVLSDEDSSKDGSMGGDEVFVSASSLTSDEPLDGSDSSTDGKRKLSKSQKKKAKKRRKKKEEEKFGQVKSG